MVTIRLLSGGDGEGPEDPEVLTSDAAAQAMRGEHIMELAESFNGIPEGMQKRRYAELLVAGMSHHQAVLTVWPQLANEHATYVAAKVRNLSRDRRVRDYIEAQQQHNGLTAAALYEEALDRMRLEIDNPANTPNVRKDLLIAYIDQLWKNGSAEAAGYQGPAKALDKGKEKEAAALPAATTDVFLQMLETEVQIPVIDVDAEPAVGAGGSK